MSGVQRTTLLRNADDRWRRDDPGKFVWLVNWKKYGFARCSVYVIAPDGHWPSKIGIAHYPNKRLQSLQTSHWKPLKVASCWWAPTVSDARAVEKKAHEMLRQDEAYLLGEWFDRSADKAAEIVEFAAMSVGVEISDHVTEPAILKDLYDIATDGFYMDEVRVRERGVIGDGFDIEYSHHWDLEDRPAEARWAAAATPLQLRGKRGT